jgi:hypothetical protein
VEIRLFSELVRCIVRGDKGADHLLLAEPVDGDVGPVVFDNLNTGDFSEVLSREARKGLSHGEESMVGEGVVFVCFEKVGRVRVSAWPVLPVAPTMRKVGAMVCKGGRCEECRMSFMNTRIISYNYELLCHAIYTCDTDGDSSRIQMKWSRTISERLY